ncbi:MAG: hypothetical protein J5689_03140 [Clostridia bacterium]|nr:hypothetical protein [Clostridia bacterium]
MIFSGAFDCFGKKRSQLESVYESAVTLAEKEIKSRSMGQFSIFDTIENSDEGSIVYPDISEYSKQILLKKEKEVLGLYVSGHPLDDYADIMKTFTFNSSMITLSSGDEVMNEDGDSEAEVLNDTGLEDGMSVTFGGMISEFKKRYTKKDNKTMAQLRVEDNYGSCEVMVFPKAYEKYKNELAEDVMLTVYGKVSIKPGERPSIIGERLEFWEKPNNNAEMMGEKIEEVKKNQILYLQYNVLDPKIHAKVMSATISKSGSVPVIVQWEKKLYNNGLSVMISDELMRDLEDLLGEENVKLVTRN